MDKIEWCERFNSGDDRLDIENRKLLNMINNLIEIRNSTGEDPQTLSSILSQIQDFAFSHFSHEEKLLMQVSKEEFSIHKEHHILFKKNLAFFCFGLFNDQKSFSLDDFCEFLANWFVSHTTTFDSHVAKVCQEETPEY